MFSWVVGGAAGLHGGIAILLVLLPLYLILSAIHRGVHDTVLCIDCHQCTAVCESVNAAHKVARKTNDPQSYFIGPAKIMKAMRADDERPLKEGNIHLCTTCLKCVEQCPLSLDVEGMVLKGRHILFQKGAHPETYREVLERLDTGKNIFGGTKSRPDAPKRARTILTKANQTYRVLKDRGVHDDEADETAGNGARGPKKASKKEGS